MALLPLWYTKLMMCGKRKPEFKPDYRVSTVFRGSLAVCFAKMSERAKELSSEHPTPPFDEKFTCASRCKLGRCLALTQAGQTDS